jgi:colanic acid/amylovoran biosynthesis glycosyltransferase
LFSHFGHQGWQDLSIPCDKRIARFYGFDLHRLPFENKEWNTRYLELFEKVDLLITEGPFMKAELVKKGCDEKKIDVLPLGVHLDNQFKIRKKDGSLKVLIAGAFKEKKGIDTALLACKAFIKKYPKQQIEIHLIGDLINDTENDRIFNKGLKKLINDSELSKVIHAHGFVSRQKLRAIALNCHVALLPSQWAKDKDCEGGFPVTFLELMATGLPIISTNHCDIPFAINDKNGIICEERNTIQLSDALQQMLEENNLQVKSIQARKTVEERFNWEILKPLYHQSILS